MNEPLHTPKIDAVAEIAQAMANTPADHPESKEIHARAGKLASHTPGPWAAGPLDRNFNAWIHNDELIVCRVTFAVDSDAAANCRLIASAPELLAALQKIAALRDPRGRLEHLAQNQAADIAEAAIQTTQIPPEVTKARAAIAKVGGKPS